MNYSESDEQKEFRSIVSRFMTQMSTSEDVRASVASESGFDPAVWQRLCQELGASQVHIPEEFGGQGFSLEELGIVMEEAGRRLYCGPLFTSVAMSSLAVLSSAKTAEKLSLLSAIGEGTQLFAVALGGNSEISKLGGSITARPLKGQIFELSGRDEYVLGAAVADTFMVFAHAPDGLSLFRVDAIAPGIENHPLQPLDLTRRLSRLNFEKVAAVRVGDPDSIDVQAFWDQMCLMLSNEMIGGAQALLDSTLQHLKSRFQFGRAIGSFQGLKHRCADLATNLELAKAATYCATRGYVSGEGEASDINMAKALANESYMEMAIAAVQLHGGMGFTWENDTHLWFRRARSSTEIFGSTQWHQETMISKILEAAK